jgi:hypothetical protein
MAHEYCMMKAMLSDIDTPPRLTIMRAGERDGEMWSWSRQERGVCLCVRGREEGRQTVWKRERGVRRRSNASVVERTSWKGVEAGGMKSVVHLSEVFSCPWPGSIDVHIECRMEEACAG